MITALIVDDSPDKHRAISEALKKHECHITVVENVANAKKELAKKCFDLAIIDLALPIWQDGEIIKNAGVDLIREVSEMSWYFFPKSVLAITQHEEYLCSASSLNELGVILYKYEADKDIQEQLKPYIQKSIKNNEQFAYDYDICIIGALRKEIEPLTNMFDQCIKCDDFSYQNFYFEKAIIQDGDNQLKIALVTLPRMGLVNSTAITMRSINLLRPKLVIMPGICAGIKTEVNIGDIIIAETCWEWQVGKVTTDDFKSEVYQIQIDDYSKGLLHTDVSYEINKFWRTFEEPRPQEKTKILSGAIVSGSSVISNQEKIREITQQHRKLLGLEMEIFGVYTACMQGWPRPKFFAAKAVCDYGDNEKHDNYQNYCANISANYIFNIIKKNINKIKEIS